MYGALQRLARRLVTLAEPGCALTISLLPEPMQARLLRRDHPSPEEPRAEPTRAESNTPDPVIDRATVENALRNARGNVRKVAQQLKMSRSQLYRWLQKNEVDPDDFRES